jgi:ABC-2 type transport system permease protein
MPSTVRLTTRKWDAQAGRSAASADADWGLVASRAGLLVLLLLASAAFATRVFDSYQGSI